LPPRKTWARSSSKKCASWFARDLPTRRTVWDRDKSGCPTSKRFGESYKAELINGFPPGAEVRVYYHARDWHISGAPHLMSTGKIGHRLQA